MLPLPYCAGFFDGEGGVSLIYTVRRRRVSSDVPILGFKFVVHVSQTSQEVLDLLQLQFGGYVNVSVNRTPTHHKKPFAWRLTGAAQQRAFLEAIQPHVVVKKEQVRLGLRYLTTVKTVGKRTSQEDWNVRADVFNELKAANQRGRHVSIREIPVAPPQDWNPARRLTPSDLANVMARTRSAKARPSTSANQ